jgi:mycothiol synthase
VTSISVRRIAGRPGLDDAQATSVRRLADRATEADGTGPLDDQVRLDLAHPADVEHVLALDASGVVGYAHVDLRSDDDAGGHLVVDPKRRRSGVGTLLVHEMVEIAAGRRLATWAHGNVAAAAGFAAHLGWSSVRELRQLRLPLSASIPDASYADGVVVRTFEPGRDEYAWVAVNAAAFADHPEQGRMTVEDLEQREEQPWFDPAGLFLAERDGKLLGSHWTKVHQHADGTSVGEVYVVGVSPDAQGLGLGKALTLTGLHHLRDQGLDVILYVDAENTAAVRLYDRIGFETIRVDVQYSPPR